MSRAEISRGPTSLAETARLSGEFADWHNIVYCVVWLTGALDLAAVREAWRGVCLRHDVLRRAYVSPDEACTYDDALSEVEVYAAETDAEALAAMRRIIEPRFDLAGLGLARVAIVQRDDHRHLLGIALDHIIVDLITWDRVMTDLAELYARATHRMSIGGDVESNAYHDFALLERRALSGSWGEERRAFWRSQTEQFGTYPPAFPVDGDAAGESRPGELIHPLPADTNARVSDLARRAGATPFVAVAAAALAGLQEVGDTATVGVTTNHHGRVLPGTADIAGLFAQKVPLRLTTRTGRPVEAVREVFSSALDMFEYNLPLWVVGRLWGEDLASIERKAGVQVRLNERSSPFGESFLVGTKAEVAPLYLTGHGSPRTLQFKWELDGAVSRIVVEHDEKYVSSAVVERMVRAAERFVCSAED